VEVVGSETEISDLADAKLEQRDTETQEVSFCTPPRPDRARGAKNFMCRGVCFGKNRGPGASPRKKAVLRAAVSCRSGDGRGRRKTEKSGRRFLLRFTPVCPRGRWRQNTAAREVRGQHIIRMGRFVRPHGDVDEKVLSSLGERLGHRHSGLPAARPSAAGRGPSVRPR